MSSLADQIQLKQLRILDLSTEKAEHEAAKAKAERETAEHILTKVREATAVTALPGVQLKGPMS